MVARPTLQTQTAHAPTSFQDFLPSTSIASPDSSNGHSPSSTKMKKSPSSTTRHSPPPLPEKALPAAPASAPPPTTSSRARFAQMARSAVGSFRSSKNQSKTPKVDPTAAALQWVESATASRNANASPSSSSALPVPHDHAPNNPRSHVSHHSDKAQMGHSATSGQAHSFTRQNTTRNKRTPKHLRIVRFKEEEEFIPSPPWTPSSLESSFEDLHLQPGSNGNTSGHMEEADDEPFTWEDLIDEEEEKITQANARPNKALAMAAALERPPVPRSRREGLRVVPPLPPAMLATVS
ncbi:hypothetical protein AAF712_003075 [Marasmius tenuissimus]|uniref:Uncharacterized protein n=1 Tax=Marasmius tenuissimus TaxID=585030 RepID=A0ABR3A8H1_9AGAR